jgi:hypothetical protein
MKKFVLFVFCCLSISVVAQTKISFVRNISVSANPETKLRHLAVGLAFTNSNSLAVATFEYRTEIPNAYYWIVPGITFSFLQRIVGKNHSKLYAGMFFAATQYAKVFGSVYPYGDKTHLDQFVICDPACPPDFDLFYQYRIFDIMPELRFEQNLLKNLIIYSSVSAGYKVSHVKSSNTKGTHVQPTAYSRLDWNLNVMLGTKVNIFMFGKGNVNSKLEQKF